MQSFNTFLHYIVLFCQSKIVDLTWWFLWFSNSRVTWSHKDRRDFLIKIFRVVFGSNFDNANHVLIHTYTGHILTRPIFLGTGTNLEYQRIMNRAVFNLMYPKEASTPRFSSFRYHERLGHYSHIHDDDVARIVFQDDSTCGDEWEDTKKNAHHIATTLGFLEN